nr:Gag-Pol polyprotein [Tanacetum cinerariifolium]
MQTKNAGYDGKTNKNAGRNRNQVFNAGNASDESNQIVQHVSRTNSTPGKENVQCYNCNEKGHYARECQKQKVHDAKYFREQMLLAMKDEVGSNLSNEEEDFMLDNAYGEETFDELTASVILMARIQIADGNAKTMKPKANIGIFIGYSKSSRGFRIYNCRTKNIMETIHVKFDELTAMASECKNLEPRMNCRNFNDSLEDSQLLISKSDLHNLFGPMYEDYYATSSQVSDNSAANTLDNDHTSSSSIVVEQDDAPQIVSSSEDQVANEPNSLVLNKVTNEFVQEDVT